MQKYLRRICRKPSVGMIAETAATSRRATSIIVCALAAATSLAAQQPARNSDNFLKPSEELNKLLPPWLQFSGEYRSRFEGTNAVGFNDIGDAYLLSRLWLGIRIQPAPWLKFFGQTQDSRVFFNDVIPSAPPYQNRWDIHQAYVEFGDAEKYALSVRVGRQELSFGDQRLVGPANWLNVPRVFDAALATVHVGGYKIFAFASSVVDSKDGLMDHHTQGNDFHGLYGSFASLVPRATIEPYLFWRLSPLSLSPVLEHGGKGKLDQKTYGIRWVGKLPATFDYGMEMVRQQGSLGADSLSAWAGHWVVGKTLAQTRATPRFLMEYNYASGDRDPKDGTRGTFDQLFPTAHDKYGLADQVGWRNIHDLRTGIELKPSRKWTASTIYHNYWLASKTDGLYTASGALIARSIDGTAGSRVGQEVDAQALYKWNRAIQIGFGYAHLFTGEFLNKTTQGKDSNYSYVMANYAF